MALQFPTTVEAWLDSDREGCVKKMALILELPVPWLACRIWNIWDMDVG